MLAIDSNGIASTRSENRFIAEASKEKDWDARLISLIDSTCYGVLLFRGWKFYVLTPCPRIIELVAALSFAIAS